MTLVFSEMLSWKINLLAETNACECGKYALLHVSKMGGYSEFFSCFGSINVQGGSDKRMRYSST